ncbi:MAG: hypothetical protein ACO4AI_13365, partial [Prochlorothrix sp.]
TENRAPRLIVTCGFAAGHNPDSYVGHWAKTLINRGVQPLQGIRLTSFLTLFLTSFIPLMPHHGGF